MNRLRVGQWAVIIGTLLLFWPCVHNGIIAGWDDDQYLHHAAVAGWGWLRLFISLQPMYYHPLTMLSHALDQACFGGNTGPAHAVTLALHGLNTGLVMWLTAMLTRRIPALRAGECIAITLSTGLVFGWHPMQVESVAWLAERKTVLCAAFMLAALGAYLRAVEGSRWCRWGATALFGAALLSKPMAVSWPVLALALDVFPLQRWPAVSWRKLIWEKWLWWLMATGLAVVTIIGQRHVDAVWAASSLSAATRLGLAARACIFYLWKIIWPAWLSPFYPQTTEVRWWDREFLF